MPDTLLSSLSSTLKLKTREEIARFLGESEQAVTRGFEFATAALFEGLHRQTGQSEVMRQVIAGSGQQVLPYRGGGCRGQDWFRSRRNRPRHGTSPAGGSRTCTFLNGHPQTVGK
jgi:hypothetical protein